MGYHLMKSSIRFPKHSVNFLGHMVDSDGIGPDLSKVTGILHNL